MALFRTPHKWYHYNGEREYRTAFVGAILRGLFLCPEMEVNQCQADRNDRVLTSAVLTLRTDSTMSNTQPFHGNSTTSTSVPRISTRSTAVRGNAYATDTSHSTLFVSVAKRKVGLFLHRKCITRYPFHRVALMQGTTL